MADDERLALEQLIRESRKVLAYSAQREGDQLDADMDGLLHRVRQRSAVRDYTSEVVQAQASRDAVMEAEQRRIDRLAKLANSGAKGSVDEVADGVTVNVPNDVSEETLSDVPGKASEDASNDGSANAYDNGSVGIQDNVVGTVSTERPDDSVPEAGELAKPATEAKLQADVVAEGGAVYSDTKIIESTWVTPVAAPARVLVVIGDRHQADSIKEVAERIALRLEGDTQVIIGGPKTLIPGAGKRVKNSTELADAVLAAQSATTILAIATSKVAAHRKTNDALLRAVEPVQVWCVIDATEGETSALEILSSLPAGTKADALAVARVWDAMNVDWLMRLEPALGMLDYAPASPYLWELVTTHK